MPDKSILEKTIRKHMVEIRPNFNCSEWEILPRIQVNVEGLLERTIAERIDVSKCLKPKDIYEEMERVVSENIRLKADYERAIQISSDLGDGFFEVESSFHRILGDNCLFLKGIYCNTSLTIESFATSKPFKDTERNSFYITVYLNRNTRSFYEKSTVMADGDFSALRAFFDDIRKNIRSFNFIYEDMELSRYIPYEYLYDAIGITERTCADLKIAEDHLEKLDYALAGKIKNFKDISNRRVATIALLESGFGTNIEVNLRIGKATKNFISESPLMFCQSVLDCLMQEYCTSSAKEKDPDLLNIEKEAHKRFELYNMHRDETGREFK